MERRFDLVVVGTGVTSAVAAARVRCAVAFPKRSWWGRPRRSITRDMANIGVPAGTLTIDWPALMRFKRSLIDSTPERTEQAFPGADRLATSEEFLNLDRMPARIVFVGGGYISFEFAHLAARAGANVTVLHRGARPLEGFDPDLVDLLVRRTRELGIRVELDTEVVGVDADARGLAHQSLRRRDPAEDFRRRPEAGALRLPDVRFRHSLHALRRAPPRFTNARVYPTKIRE
jgi:NADPH-dependent 2,4-dienoyl-CoA reductase/sulfur reductase-like enzyme